MSENILIYTRVSTQKQAEIVKCSLPAQEKYCRDYAKSKKYKVVDVVYDIGSAYNTKKDGQGKLDVRISELVCTNLQKVTKIICVSHDRFSRNEDKAIDVLTQLLTKGIVLECVENNIVYDVDNIDKLKNMFSVIQTVSQQHGKKIQRIKTFMQIDINGKNASVTNIKNCPTCGHNSKLIQKMGEICNHLVNIKRNIEFDYEHYVDLRKMTDSLRAKLGIDDIETDEDLEFRIKNDNRERDEKQKEVTKLANIINELENIYGKYM